METQRIGIVGGGQLGRMLTGPAHEMGFEITTVDKSPNCPAAQVGAEQIEAPLDDEEALDKLAERSDVITWEIEHFAAEHLRNLAESGVDVQPDPETLLRIQDKLQQKQLLEDHGIPVVPFSEELDEDKFTGEGLYVVKTRTGGFDGRGNLVVSSLNDPRIEEQFKDQPIYVEQAVDFEKELSVIAAKDREGNTAFYPTVETIHHNNICHTVLYPVHIDPEVDDQAKQVATTTMEALDGAGVFAMEMFVIDGEVYINEIAPRVHNSGHLTMEASETSQFEQHIRAVTGLPLGRARPKTPAAVMINILGGQEGPLDRSGTDEVLAQPDTKIHWYGKSPKPERKIGHITVCAEDRDSAQQRAETARGQLSVQNQSIHRH